MSKRRKTAYFYCSAQNLVDDDVDDDDVSEDDDDDDDEDEDSYTMNDIWQNYRDKQLMWFHNTCSLLRENSTDYVSLDTEEDGPERYNDGADMGIYGKRMGQAVQKNTVVSNLTLDIYTFRGDNCSPNEPAPTKVQHANMAPMLHFISTGVALRHVTVRDELGTQRQTRRTAVSMTWGDWAVAAAAQHLHLQSLTLEEGLQVSPTALAAMLQQQSSSSGSLSSLQLCFSIFRDYAMASTSTSSKTSHSLAWVETLADAAAIATVSSWRIRVLHHTAAWIVHFMNRLGQQQAALSSHHQPHIRRSSRRQQQTRPVSKLQELDLRFDWEQSDGRPFQYNANGDHDNHVQTAAMAVFRGMELQVQTAAQTLAASAAFAQTTTASRNDDDGDYPSTSQKPTMPVHLCLGSYDVSLASMDTLMQSLKMCHAPFKLSLVDGCVVCPEATEAFLGYMQTLTTTTAHSNDSQALAPCMADKKRKRTTRMTNTMETAESSRGRKRTTRMTNTMETAESSRGRGSGVLSELCVSEWAGTMEGLDGNESLKRLLTVPLTVLPCSTTHTSTIGSSLQVLTLHGRSDFGLAMSVLGDNARTIRLPCLRFAWQYPNGDDDLAAFRSTLPKLVYLKELSFETEAENETFPWKANDILKVLRINGSLLRFAAGNHKRVFDKETQLRLDAYLTRNAHLCRMVTNPPMIEAASAATMSSRLATKKHKTSMPAAGTNANDPTTPASLPQRKDLSLVPPLFVLADKTTPASTANTLLMGLLAATAKAVDADAETSDNENND